MYWQIHMYWQIIPDDSLNNGFCTPAKQMFAGGGGGGGGG